MTPERLTLSGCSPTPLASYLKALGVLRLLSSAANHVAGAPADPHVRGWWEREHFHLSTTLGREGVIEFFLHHYAPSPVIAPWNGGSGFYAKDNKDGFGPMSSSAVAERFGPFASAIQVASECLQQLDLQTRPQGDQKARLVAMLRARLPEYSLPWLDAALVLSGDRLRFPQLLGTGGNDGRLDFTNNVMRRLVSRRKSPGIFDASSGLPSPPSASLLENALFGTPILGLSGVKVGQFSPGVAGGPNATTGYDGDPTVNSWDYVLMMEGAATFACAATRRHQTNAPAHASFPFTVGVSGAGSGGVEVTDETDARAEFWAPLWTRPARFCEVEALFGEGRAVTNGRTARDGLDFARAVASLGVSRGFSEFQRYGFFQRAGRSHYAAPLTRRRVTASTGAVLMADLDTGGWLDRVRRSARGPNQPASLRHAVKRLEDALFELLAPETSRLSVGGTLKAIGRLATLLRSSPQARESVPPPPLLSPDWLQRADDGSPEFRVAAALAGLGIPSPAATHRDGNPPPPMAAHLAPLTNGPEGDFEANTFIRNRRLRGRRAWATSGNPPTVVWGHGGLVTNLIAVLERRLLEVSIRSLNDKPLKSASFARLSDVAEFLNGDFDDGRCSSLLAGMAWARPTWFSNDSDGEQSRAIVPLAYSALKPLFSTDESLASVEAIPAGAKMPIPPGLVRLLRAGGSETGGGATDRAVRVALARARSSGLPSPFDPMLSGSRRAAGHLGRIGVGVAPDRLAAALLIPISDPDLRSLLRRAYLEPNRNEPHTPEN